MSRVRLVPLLVAVAVLGGGGCKPAARQKAAEAYRAELRAHRHRFERFNAEYPKVELQLKGPRHAKPADVVRIIREQMLPLLDRTVAGFDPLVARGRAYVKLLGDSVKAKPKLHRAIEDFAGQKEAMLEIRKTYVDEAALFARGKPAPEAMRAILKARIAAARKLQRRGQ